MVTQDRRVVVIPLRLQPEHGMRISAILDRRLNDLRAPREHLKEFDRVQLLLGMWE